VSSDGGDAVVKLPDKQCKPTVIIVPGEWHVPDHYEALSKALRVKGYHVLVVHLATTRNNAPWPVNYHADEAVVASTILEQANKGREIVLVMHSYGGFPGSAACCRLLKKQIQENGEKGGVVATVYMATSTFAIADGSCSTDLGDLFIIEVSAPWVQIRLLVLRTGANKTETDIMAVRDAVTTLYHDCSAEDQERLPTLLKDFPRKLGAEKRDLAPCGNVPSIYMVCLDGRAVPPEA
jgi:hypothetical protein